uniref:G_PROTEIN_RECEP_F1_2 domain-containing protein n=1 Tax=Bursaphelenchus xylophilus TaxID=6326 RepID=A0A1I7RJQ0_BURXY
MSTLHFEPTQDNPYAWDIIQDTDQSFVEPYDELASFTKFLKINYVLTTFVGGILSFTLLYLIIFQTNGALKNYRKMLLICSVTDISYWAIDNLLGLKLKEKDGVYMVKFEGPAKDFDRPTRLVLIAAYVCSICFVNSVLPAQVYFRYYALTRSQFLSTGRTLGVFLLSFLAALPTFFLAYNGYGFTARVRPGFNYGELWYKEVPLPPVFYADVRSVYQKIYFFYGGLLISASYTAASVMGYLTVKKINLLYSSYSERTRRLQTQLSQYLIVQSIIPLIVSVTPLMLIVVPAFLYSDTGKACLFYGVLFSWIPILNPLITMIVIVPYRQVILQKLGVHKGMREVTSTNHPNRSKTESR